jgi:subtilisin family serine protease
MASPHVAGTAALVWAANSSWLNDDVRYQLQITAEDLGATGWDSKYGWGLVDAAEAAGVETLPPNEPPTISITSPTDGSTFDSGATILFEGTASDTEDGNLTASLDWTSNIDGSIGTGGSFSTILSDGTHTIIAGAHLLLTICM